MESHYCRENTDKLYLEEDFKSKTEVYELYKEKCIADSVTPLSMFSFSREMDANNIGLFKRRKDQDVQAVKLCPKLEVSTAYYKTKLQVHNFTMYNLKTHQSKNFMWNESEGELCSSVFATCIVKHLESFLNIKVKPVVLWSDSCGYQNKNNILSNALSLLATKYSVTVEQKYLEKGHTQMECDSTHSLIERRLKGKDMYLPTDYINIIKDARKNPFPLDVEYLNHTYFLNFEDINCKRYNSIRPGSKKNDLKVNNLRCLKYEANGEIFYKCKFADNYELLPQRQKAVDINYVPKPLYQERLKIKKVKWTHLQEFKSVLPKDVHFFYDALQYEEKGKVKECGKPKTVEEDPDEISDSEKPKVERSIGKKPTTKSEKAANNIKMNQVAKVKLNYKIKQNQKSGKENKKKPEECRKSDRTKK
ncbi:unnamed protein product [Ceutorhynchus assimilis]|uniref:DUF7869 domain-containing protein n=1 Tax=Ceutorhynchus assimilis TaxID=467358 RepID=A0A9N9MUM8_9CUCU|nr:unnamed protein product [Ceutorhynchus assimilis]